MATMLIVTVDYDDGQTPQQIRDQVQRALDATVGGATVDLPGNPSD